MFRMLLLAAAACFALAGCTTTSSIDTAIQKNLPQVCEAASTAHTAYFAYSLVGKVSARDAARVEAAWAALEPICADPSSQTTGDVLIAAIAAYSTIAKALTAAG